MGWMVAVWLVTTILGELLRPKQKKPKPAGLDEFSFPTATADRKIPVIAGTVQIRGSNLVWYGDYRTKAIKVSSGGGLFGGGSKQTIGYRYYVGMHFVLCHGPIDSFIRIGFEKKTAWIGSIKDGQVFIDQQELFGDKDAEGGVRAAVDFHSGESAQAVNAYLDGQLGGDIPAWGGLAYVVWQRPGYVGNSPSIRPMVFEVKRLPRPLGSGKHDINGDANPAELLYELHTSPDWGAGMAPAQLDTASFLAAANTLHAEGLGISLVWDRQGTVQDLAQQILEHIDGLIYSDPATGLRKLKLIRQDYVIGSLPVLDQTNVLALEKFSRGAWDETTNEIVVSYTDRAAGFEPRTVTAQDLANQHIQGAVISASLDYQGASNATTAGLIAWRELRLRSQPMAQVTLQVNRAAHAFRPGDAFKLNWPELGITDMVFRVGKIRYGELTEGRIQLDAVQDLFATDASIYAPTPATGWQSPSQAPAAAPNAAVIEAPYWIIAGDPTITDKASGNLLTVAQRPGGDVDGYEIWTRRSTQAFALRGLAPGFTPTGVLVSALPLATTSTLTLTSAVDLDLLEGADRPRGETLLLVDSEWMAYDPAQVVDNGDGTFTFAGVWRGVLDTVPAPHSAGARAWLLAEASGTTADSYPPTDTVDVRQLTITSQGTLPLASAPILSRTFTQRPSRPYVPGNVKINGVAYPAAILGAYTLTWAHRDRLQQQDVIAQSNASVGPEAGATYTLRLYGEADTLLRTETGLTGTSYTWSAEEADSGLGVPGVSNSDEHWSKVVALLHMDGAHGATSISDSTGRTWTRTGTGAALSNEQSRFGPTSLKNTNPSSDFNAAAGILTATDLFTVEGWFYLLGAPFTGSGNAQEHALVTQGAFSANGAFGAGIRYSTMKLYFDFRGGNGGDGGIEGSSTLSLNTWYHFAATWDGATHRGFINGALEYAVAKSFGWKNTGQPMRVGRMTENSSVWERAINGYIDEVRVTKGVARYTSAFTPPASPFPSAGANRLNGRIRAELESVRAGLTSHQKHNITVDRAGWGYQWGNYWGGI